MSKQAPSEPCFAIFKGARHIRGGIYEHIHEPVQVQQYMNRGACELAVTMTGRAMRFPLRNFVGEWQVLELEAA